VLPPQPVQLVPQCRQVCLGVGCLPKPRTQSSCLFSYPSKWKKM